MLSLHTVIEERMEADQGFNGGNLHPDVENPVWHEVYQRAIPAFIPTDDEDLGVAWLT